MAQPIRAAAFAAQKRALRAARKAGKYKKLKRTKTAAKARGQSASLSQKRPYLTSPEGLIILATALIFDFIPSPLNIPGTIAVNIWLYFRGGFRSRRGGLGKFAKKRGFWIVLELIPVLNMFIPTLTVAVFKTLRKV